MVPGRTLMRNNPWQTTGPTHERCFHILAFYDLQLDLMVYSI